MMMLQAPTQAPRPSRERRGHDTRYAFRRVARRGSFRWWRRSCCAAASAAPEGNWHFAVSPYLWLPAFTAVSAIRTADKSPLAHPRATCFHTFELD